MTLNSRTFDDGVLVEEVRVDLDANSVSGFEHGALVWSRQLTAEERSAELPKGLDPLGALATLLAVHEVVPVTEAAAAVGLTAQDLVDEALAWGVAGQA